MGIMGVVTDVGSNVEDEREPTWEDAVKARAGGTPVEVVRPRRRITVVYRYRDGAVIASSPQLRSLRATGATLEEARRLVREDLDRFLDPEVEIHEDLPHTEPRPCTVAAGRSWMYLLDSSVILAASSSGTARSFITPAHPVPVPTHGLLREARASR
jgi:predicted RNase H-like HicB family nuclease